MDYPVRAKNITSYNPCDRSAAGDKRSSRIDTVRNCLARRADPGISSIELGRVADIPVDDLSYQSRPHLDVG